MAEPWRPPGLAHALIAGIALLTLAAIVAAAVYVLVVLVLAMGGPR